VPLIPARFRRPDPAEAKKEAIRKDIEVLKKAMQGIGAGSSGASAGAMGPVMPGSQFQGGWNNLGNASMAMLQRVTANMARQHDVPVADIEQQLIEQGLTWGPPFPPGRPLDPFFGWRRAPRTRDYTVGENVQLTPRWDRVSFETIKSLYNAYDVAQICVRMKINDIRSLDYDWVPLPGERDDVSKDIDQARAFFQYPDKAQPFRNWLAEWLQDVLRYDAGALYVRRTNAGKPYALEVVTGSSLIPLIDYYGRVAADRDDDNPPAEGVWSGGDTPGFLQIIEGMPWDWLTIDDIIYQPWNPLPESQYGLAPLEAILLSANTDLRFQQHFLEYFTAGSLPAGFMEAPEDLSDPAQIAELQEAWDALMIGDQEMLRRIRFVPNGSTFTAVKNSDFDSEFPLYLMRRTAAAYGVTPANLGYTETVNRASSDTQVDIQWRVGTLPLVRHVEDVINLFVTQHLGLRCQLQFDKGQEVEDRLMTMQAHQGYVDMGAISVDEVRAELGKPIDRTRPIPRMINNARLGPIPLIAIESMSGKIDEETYAPDARQELVSNPYIGAPGVIPAHGSPEEKAAAAANAQMQRELLQATTGQPPTPEMLAQIAAATPSPAGQNPAGPSKGPEGTTAQPAEVPPGQGAGSSPEPADASQTASKATVLKDGLGGGGNVSGIFSATSGIQGDPLASGSGPADDDDEDDETSEQYGFNEEWKAAKSLDALLELRRWRENARNRIRKGQSPRQFRSTAIPPDVQALIWSRLEKAESRREVNAIFADVVSGRPFRYQSRYQPRSRISHP
jgi:Phage portal protein